MTWEQLCSSQCGLIARPQAVECGLSLDQIDRLLANQTWRRIFPSVYRVAAAPTVWPQPQMAAFLWAKTGAVVSHAAAARLWGLDDFAESDAVELSSRHGLTAPPGITCYRTRHLMKSETCELPTHDCEVPGVDGMIITSVARTLLDLASTQPRRVERALDEARRRSMVTLDQLEHCLELNHRCGRAGSGLLAALAQDRKTFGATDSSLETDALAVLAAGRLPSPHRQYRVLTATRFIAQVDFAWPEHQVALQVHSSTLHRESKTWEKDQRTENALALAGWTVIKVTRAVVEKQPHELVANLRRALAHR